MMNRLRSLVGPRVRRWVRTVDARVHAGTNVTCELCGWNGRSFRGSACRKCGSLPRHRLVPFALRYFEVRLDGKCLFHAGPNQPEISGVRRICSPALYLTSDWVRRPFINVVADLTRLPLRDASVDGVVIWHVLEHIPDDAAVIAEMHRILKPGGRAVVSVPIYPPGNEVTVEDLSLSPDERRGKYGHFDHVRACGHDYAQRFEAKGFVTTTLRVQDLEPAVRDRLGLSPSHVAWCFERAG